MRPWHRFYPRGLAPHGTYPDIPVWGFLEHAAQQHPRKLALVDGERGHSYEDLWRRALDVAGWIRAQGTRPGDRVLLRLPNSTDFVTSYYGALRAGCVVVASSPELPASLYDDAEPRLVIDREPGAATAPDPGDGDVAVLQYTSGTTGRSRGAVMSHRNLACNALQNARWFAWTPGEVQLCVLPLFHTWGMCVCLNSTFAMGATLVLADHRETLDAAERHAATVLYGSATLLHRLLDEPARALPALRHVKAGAMLSQGGLKDRWDARYPHAPLQQGYGLTEASPECHNNPPQRFKPGTVGIPIQDTDCRIADDGEILIAGPQVCSGYWTEEPFQDGWLRTGDIGVMDEDGYLTIVDRKKDMLKFRGYTVSPNAVEECLLAHEGVREAVVVGRPDERDGDVPVAFIVGDVDDAALLEHCRAHLARYQVPREFVRIEAIPKNAVGKPLRRELRDTL